MKLMDGGNHSVVSEFLLQGLTSSWEIQILLFLFFTVFYIASMLGNLLIVLTILSGGTSGKEPTCQSRRRKRHRSNLWIKKIPRRSYSNTLHYSCLGNPMDRGAWWATVHRVAKSQIRLRQLSTHGHIWSWIASSRLLSLAGLLDKASCKWITEVDFRTTY